MGRWQAKPGQNEDGQELQWKRALKRGEKDKNKQHWVKHVVVVFYEPIVVISSVSLVISTVENGDSLRAAADNNHWTKSN